MKPKLVVTFHLAFSPLLLQNVRRFNVQITGVLLEVNQYEK